MELPAGTIVTARRPNKRVRWRSAVVQEPAAQSTHTHVKLKFEGESHVHSLPWSHLQLPRTERVSAVEPPPRLVSTSATTAAPEVIDLDTSPFSQANGARNDERREEDEGETVQMRTGENGGGMDFMRMTREWLMEKKEPQEKVEARKREEARKRQEAARREEMRKKEEDRERTEMGRVGRADALELPKAGAEGIRRGGASLVFSFADYVEQARSAGGRATRDLCNRLHENGRIPQKRKPVFSDGTLNGTGAVNRLDSNMWMRVERGEVDNNEIKRRRTSIELGESLYSLPGAQEGPSLDVNERHPMQSSKDDFFYRIPRRGGYRPHASGATHVPPIRLSLQPRTEIRAETGENRSPLTEMQEHEMSVSSGGLPVRHGRVRGPPASRVATQFEASNSPFGDNIIFGDDDSEVLDLCGDFSTVACVGEISQKLAKTSLQNPITMRGKGRKSRKPNRWCNPYVLTLQEVSAQQRNCHNFTQDIEDNQHHATRVANDSLAHSDDVQHRIGCPEAHELPIIMQCVCNRACLPDGDLRNAIQCRMCGLWSHLMCTQLNQDPSNAKDDFRQRFICVQCLEKVTGTTHVAVIFSDDETENSGDDDIGLEQTHRNGDESPLTVQIRSLPQILNEFEECDKRRRTKSTLTSTPKATYDKSDYIRRSPLTREDVIARAENIEELRSGVCKPSIEEDEQDMISALMKNAQRSMWMKSYNMPHGKAEAEDTVSMTRVALKRTLT